MPLPELHEWTIIRLSFALEDRVCTCVAATGYVYNRAGFPDGTLILTSDVQWLDETERRLGTRNTTYRLNGLAVPFENWDELRYETVWSIGNDDSGLLSNLEGVQPPCEWCSTTTWDPTVVMRHAAQRDLITAVNLGTDIDNGLRELAFTGKIGSRGYQMRLTILNDLGGIQPVIGHPEFPSALTLVIDDVAKAPTRLIPIAETAKKAVSFLPLKLGPWARCAWLIAKNPNLHDCDTPVAAIENGRFEDAAQAAKTFPRFDITE